MSPRRAGKFETKVALVAIALVASAVAGCDDGGSNPGDPDAGDTADIDAMPLSPACMEATTRSDLAWVQDNVFTPSCARFSSCHMGGAPSAGGLNLEDGNSMANMVGIASKTVPGMSIVAAGDANNSYLMVTIGHIDGTLPMVGTMPFNSPLLCVEKREAIERWINSL